MTPIELAAALTVVVGAWLGLFVGIVVLRWAAFLGLLFIGVAMEWLCYFLEGPRR
jgi:hypothetical protein